MIEPIELASRSLLNYQNSKLVPKLPMHFEDETGILLATIQTSIDNNENYLKDKQDFIYLLSHDLRGFAAKVKGLAALIKEEGSAEMITQYTAMMELTAEQQLAFIATCIQLLKEEDEIYGNDSKSTLINLQDIVQDVFDQLLTRLGAKKIDLKLHIAIPSVMLTIDKDLLTRVLFNLVDNAIKFSYPSSTITINTALENGKLRMSVSDQGLGFKPEDGKKLFDKFTTKGRVGTNNEASTGIGLYLCKKIVEKYKGSIEAKSEGVNKGAIFSIVLDAH
ncbi:MAG: sensor histidine kinase [Flavobacterium sp.]